MKDFNTNENAREGLINWSNEYYSLKNSNAILWLMIDEDPAEENINGGYEYRVIKSDKTAIDDYLDNVKYSDGKDDILWGIIENNTVEYGYIECDENYNAYLSQIEDIKIDDIDCYLCGFDSDHGIEGYISALQRNGEEEIADTLFNILSGDVDKSRDGEER